MAGHKAKSIEKLFRFVGIAYFCFMGTKNPPQKYGFYFNIGNKEDDKVKRKHQ